MKRICLILGIIFSLVMVASMAFAAPVEVTYSGEKYAAQNIGDTDMGKVSVSGNKIVMTGAGADIWGTADAFYYMYKPIDGDFTATLKLTTVSDADGWAKMGIMFRTALEAGSSHAIVVATNQNNLALQWRPEAEGESSHIAGADPYENGTDVYLKMVRKAGNITGAYSFDNKAWVDFEITDPITVAGKGFIGVCHTSHNAGEVGQDGVAFDFVVK